MHNALQKLIGNTAILAENIANDAISHVTDNSKEVIPGSLYVSVSDKYVEEAIANGAQYIVRQSQAHPPSDIINNLAHHIYVSDIRKTLSSIASIAFPNELNNVAAVTGTNGKSSTVDIVRQLWNLAGDKSASIGTLGVIADKPLLKLENHMTCPPILAMHKILHGLSAEHAIKNVAIEASSHGIHQHRIGAIKFSVCAFTNFTQDHLDYHKTMQAYWDCKKKLFSDFASNDSVFVINADCAGYSDDIVKIAKDRNIKYIDYGQNAKDIHLLSIQYSESHQEVSVLCFGEAINFTLSLQGTFQVYNALCAAGICIATGYDVHSVFNNMKNLSSINGRMEKITSFNGANIYVDYAHTPDALSSAILSIKSHVKNKLFVIIGCGGERDAEKRPIMGEIAHQLADIVIVTDDNPRNEDPASIRKDILSKIQSHLSSNQNCTDSNALVIEIPDRKKAIESALNMISNGDCLLICGKGHETCQMIGGCIVDFSDKDVVINYCKSNIQRKI